MTEETNQQIYLNTENLTEWENEPKLIDLKNDLKEALPDHQLAVNKINTWIDNLNITGKAKPKKISGRSSVQPKLIRKQSEWRCASLSEPFLSTEDLFNVDPVSAGDRHAAEQNALVLNNQFNTKLGKIKFIDDLVKAGVNKGTMIIRTGWDYRTETVRVENPVFKYHSIIDPEEYQTALQQEQEVHMLMENYPDDYNQLPIEVREMHELFMQNGTPYYAEKVGTTIVEEVKTLVNKPTVEVCNYRHVIIDPTAKGDPDKAEFVIYEFETSMSELEKSGIDYKNLDKIVIDNSSPLAAPDTEPTPQPSFKFKDNPRKKLQAYEYWGYWDIHKTGSTVPIVATWVGDTLIRMEENPFPDKKLPFVIRAYMPIDDSIYGEPDGELLEDNQKVIGAVSRGMIDIMARSANGQKGMRTDALDAVNKRKYNKGLDYEFNPTVDPRNAIIDHVYPEIPQSAQFMINMQNAEAEALTGVKAFSQGISGSALGDNVGGIRSALDATAKRDGILLQRIADGVIEVGRKIISMNSEFLEEDEVVRVTNNKFVPIRKDDLAGNFDLRLSISTAEADNAKAQELAFMLQTGAASADPEEVRMIRAEIARLRKMPDLARRIEEFQPTPDPLEVKKQELEIALLEAKVANEIAKGNENAVDVELKGAKAETEKAKARQLGSTADLQDLDFLDKESGREHQEKMLEKEHDRLTSLDLKAADTVLREETVKDTSQ